MFPFSFLEIKALKITGYPRLVEGAVPVADFLEVASE